MQIQTDPGYTLSTSGTSGEVGQVVLAKHLSQIHRLDAPTRCERFSLTLGGEVFHQTADRLGEMEVVLVTGHCVAITADRAALAAMRSGFHGRIGDFVILDQTITKEPLTPVYRQGDPNWATVVDGTIRAMILAETLRITRANLDTMKLNGDLAVAELLGSGTANVSPLKPGWAAGVVSALGNCGEIYNPGSRRAIAAEAGPTG